MRLNVYSSAVLQGVDLFAQKFYVDRVVPQHGQQPFLASELGHPTVKTASLCIPSFWHNTGVWRIDGCICSSIYSAYKASCVASYENT